MSGKTALWLADQLDPVLLGGVAGVLASVPAAKQQTTIETPFDRDFEALLRRASELSRNNRDVKPLHKDSNIDVPQFGRWDEDAGEVRALVRLIVWTVVLLGAIAGAVYGLGRFVFRI